MFKFTLATPQKKIFTDAEAEEIIVPAHRGQLDILSGHVPLMTTLQAGEIKFRLKGELTFKSVAMSWGYCEVNPTGIIVLADTVEWPEEIDVARAEDQLKIAHERLQQAGLSPEDYSVILRKIEKETARLNISGQRPG
jgi:F-type H+-transporting ATPase subunit epsilon